MGSGVNYLSITPGATGVAPTIGNGGSDTNGSGLGLSVTAKTATAAGVGGALTLKGGNGNAANAGGALSLTAGTGGASGGGGAISVTGGNGGSTSGAAGGVTIAGGTPVSGNGGSVAMNASAGVGGTNAGGSVTITGGAGVASGGGGNITLTPGTSPSGTSGSILMSSAVTTGTAATAGVQGAFNSLTTGNGMDLSSTSLTSGTLLNLSSNSTAAAANVQALLTATLTGANATSTQTTYAGQFANSHTGTGSTNIALYTTASGGTNNYAAIFNAGNVGIGTLTPNAVLHVNQNTGANTNVYPLIISNNAATGGDGIGMIFQTPNTTDSTSRNWSIGSDITNYGLLEFAVSTSASSSPAGTAPVMVIDSSGRVGIGNSSPAQALDVTGNIKIEGSNQISFNTNGSIAYNTTTIDGSANNIVFSNASNEAIVLQTSGAAAINLRTNNTSRMWISSAGNVAIGSTVPGATLDVSGTIVSRRIAATFGATMTVDWSKGNIQSLAMTANVTSMTFSNPVDGAKYILMIKQDATGSRTIAWPATVRWPGGTAPTLTTTANKTDYITFIYNGVDSKYDGVGIVQNF